MNLNIEKLAAAITTAQTAGPVYYDIDSRLKCELCFLKEKIRFVVCLHRSALQAGQLRSMALRRHQLPDLYASIKIGVDSDLNMYAGKSLTYIASAQVIKEIENICEFLTQ